MDENEPTLEVTVVHAPACHFCDDAERTLAGFAERFRLAVRLVSVDSAEGRALVAAHRPAMNPLVLVAGAYFSAGRLPRRKLEKLLTAGTAGAASAAGTARAASAARAASVPGASAMGPE